MTMHIALVESIGGRGVLDKLHALHPGLDLENVVQLGVPAAVVLVDVILDRQGEDLLIRSPEKPSDLD